ncbi:PRC-barrel domain-containing protein [Methylocapsa sp. S129]|uniref:PRC-barrel domain-containing protein n=1 Tax=Methylocapsa sp. S129 TaxID=1641869 RepID=UPI00131CE1E6|nr:PRC-barrel domain-containing protein [Methylocapsa sp. S129]
MLQVISAFNGYAIEASDGGIGSVSDFLFDDQSWKLRWLVIDAGSWLAERKVLVHPSAIGQADYEGRKLAVALTKTEVEGSPDIREHQPVSRQMESELYSYYGWDPLWGGGYLGAEAGAIAAPLATEPYFGIASIRDAAAVDPAPDDADPHLQSVAAITGCPIAASDGDIGHVEDLLIDAALWTVNYFVVDTSNWWLGKRVLMSPHAVTTIDWTERRVELNVTRDQVKASPPWDPLALMDQAGMKRLHDHYGWPGSRA